MKNIIFLSVSLLIFSCSEKESKNKNQEENMDGGPCSYQEDYFPIKILSIDTTSESDCELTLLKIIEEDTIYYSHYNNTVLELKDLQENGIHLGDTITFVEMNIETGSCNPFIQKVSLDQYNSKLAQ